MKKNVVRALAILLIVIVTVTVTHLVDSGSLHVTLPGSQAVTATPKPTLSPTPSPTPDLSKLCKDPRFEAYRFAESAILSDFGKLEEKILKDYPERPAPPNIGELEKDAKLLRLYSDSLALLSPPEGLNVYHEALTNYYDAYARTIELLAKGKRVESSSWIGLAIKYEQEMNNEKARLYDVCN